MFKRKGTHSWVEVDFRVEGQSNVPDSPTPCPLKSRRGPLQIDAISDLGRRI